MSDTPARLRWWQFQNIRRTRWTVWLAEPGHSGLHHADHGECLGVTNFARRSVHIDLAQSVAKIAETTLHELLHVAKDDGVGEDFIRAVERPLWHILARHGFVLPPFPTGFDALHRKHMTKNQRAAWSE